MAASAREIDAFVGGRIRMRREALGISQGSLARHLGLSVSQITKYEKGWNRIGAGRLYQVAGSLGVPISHFYEGLAEPPPGDATPRDEAEDLAEAFIAIPEGKIRASVLALVLSIASTVERPAGDLSGRGLE